MPKGESVESLYQFIQQKPEYFAWIFCIVNILWLGFIYFNKKSHDKDLKNIQHSLNIDLERRKKLFELKISHCEQYVKMLDDFGKKYQSGLFKRMKPMFEEYMAKMIDAKNDEEKSTALSMFTLNVMVLMDESMKEYGVLKSQSKALKLTASDTLLEIFEELEKLVENSIESVKEFINALPVLILSGNQVEIQNKQVVLNEEGECIRLKSVELERQMRLELKDF